jgi:hypothetical protein
MRIVALAAVAAFTIAGVAHAKDMKSCNADWKTAKAAKTTQTHKAFMAACLQGPATAPAPAAAMAPTAKPSLFSHSKPAAGPATPTVAAGAKPAGATAECKDGTWSTSKTHSGSCSHHGGVAHFLQ